ncbi:hypothetical protein ABT255_48105, partial [Streptomyces mirabilis]|uniref:hypothetical protein n=1 Tax=Streptomyces mirabilis TaxID=68239 RepID=UPI0033296D4A
MTDIASNVACLGISLILEVPTSAGLVSELIRVPASQVAGLSLRVPAPGLVAGVGAGLITCAVVGVVGGPATVGAAAIVGGPTTVGAAAIVGGPTTVGAAAIVGGPTTVGAAAIV